MQAEGLRSYPLEDVLRSLGYRRDPDDAARWRRRESVVSINGFMFYDHLRGECGAGAIELVIHARRCTVPGALAFLSELPGCSRLSSDCLCARAPRTLKPSRSERRWPAVERYLLDERGVSSVLLALCRDLLYADHHGNAVFVCRNAAGEATGAEIVPTAGQQRGGAAPAGEAAPSPLTPGSFWMSWEIDWPPFVLIAKSALDALSALSLHPHAGQAQRMCRGLHRRRHGNRSQSGSRPGTPAGSSAPTTPPHTAMTPPNGCSERTTGSSACAPPSTARTGMTCSSETAPANRSEPMTGRSTEWRQPPPDRRRAAQPEPESDPRQNPNPEIRGTEPGQAQKHLCEPACSRPLQKSTK